MNIIFRGGSAQQFAALIAQEVVNKMTSRGRIRSKKQPVFTFEQRAVDAVLANLGLDPSDRRRIISDLKSNTVEAMIAEAISKGGK